MSIAKQLAELRQMGVMALRVRYGQVFGEETRAGNKAWLIKRIAWRMQAQAEGDLSERARQRAAQLANDADLRLSPPRAPAANPPGSAVAGPIDALAVSANFDRRLPPPGTLLTRPYKGQSVQVLILDKGFEFEGRVYRSLSAVAKQVTGTHCNGFLFFNLINKGNKP